MIRQLLSLFRSAPEPRRLVLFGLMTVLALLTGFFSVSPAAGERLIGAWGYFYLLGLFALFVCLAWRVAATRRESSSQSLFSNSKNRVRRTVGSKP